MRNSTKKVINIDLVNLLLAKGYKLKHVAREMDYKRNTPKVLFYFEYSEKIDKEVDNFMIELRQSKQ